MESLVSHKSRFRPPDAYVNTIKERQENRYFVTYNEQLYN